MKLATLVCVALSLVSVGCVGPQARLSAPAEAWDAAAPATSAGFVSAAPSQALELRDRGEPGGGPAEAVAEAPREARAVIYTAGVSLVVLSPSAAQASIKSFAESAGGWMSESDSRSITVRVPAAQFEPVLERIATLGEVVDRSIKAADVTEQLVELDIRLDNARRARERLLAHLEKSEKMEDTLRIEAELARVTLELEAIEGKLRFLRSQVAMSTIRVQLNRPSPEERDDGLGVPFEWVNRLGDGLVAGSVEARPRKPHIFSSGPRFEPPAQFVRYYSSDALVEAMSADGVRIKLQRFSNFDKGALAFWSQLARRALVQGRSLSVGGECDLGEDRWLLRGQREVAGVVHEYLLVLARTREHVFAFEAWGPAAAFAPLAAELEKSALSLRR